MNRVLFYRHPEAAWNRIVYPWFQFWMREAWKQEQPVAFLAPDGSTIAWVKRQLAMAQCSALGIDFLTPGVMRARLRGSIGKDRPLALREDLRLLMEMAAGELLENPMAQAVALEPSDFIRVCDRLDGSGWGPDVIAMPDARELAETYFARLRDAGMQTAAQSDRELAATARGTEPVFSQIMAFGFSSDHTAYTTLLRSLNEAAESVAYCLGVTESDEGSLVWRATFEALGDADELTDNEAESPYSALVDAAEQQEVGTDVDVPLPVKIAPDIVAEATAIRNRIMAWQCEAQGSPRIGVVFAADGQPLARECARQLCAAELEHQDEIGRQPGRTNAQRLFEAWIAYQESLDGDATRAFVRELRCSGRIDSAAERSLRRAVERAFDQAMTSDLSVLRPLIVDQSRGDPLRHFFIEWPILPERESFARYVELVLPVLQRFGWPARDDAWQHRAEGLGSALNAPIPRAQYLRWLGDVCRIPGRTRDKLGREPFGSIVLTTVERAANQGWTHLIFAGLNRGEWPPEANDDLLLDARQCAGLNRRATVPSPVGDGQSCLRTGKVWLNSRGTESAQFTAACNRLLRIVSCETFFTAHRESPGENGRDQDLADWLIGLLNAMHGCAPTEDDLREACGKEAPDAGPRAMSFPELANAWQSRRDPSTPFDGFSYCIENPLPEPITLSSKAWEDAIQRPSHGWHRYLLKVESDRDLIERDPRAKSVGTWAHAWAAPAGEGAGFTEQSNLQDWWALIEQRAQAVRHSVASAYTKAGRSLPDWWVADWSRARQFARQFAVSIAAQDWPSVSAEWTLPAKPISLPNHPLDGLSISGRIDLVLADSPPDQLGNPDAWRPESAAWIIDFKTGGDKPLSAKKLAKGEGVQLGLYALALHSLGAERVQTSLVRPGEPLAPQVSLEGLLLLDGLWTGIGAIARSGSFGARATEEADFGFAGEFPIAITPIKPSILESKWQLTHPHLAELGE